MPSLNRLTCHIELNPSNLRLREHDTTYGDGVVETFIAIPKRSTTFSIHLTSNGYIAPGLSMFVYIDGVYQCNRNRTDLQLPNEQHSSRRSEVDFRVRQKEVRRNDDFVGHDWSFAKLNVGKGTFILTLSRID